MLDMSTRGGGSRGGITPPPASGRGSGILKVALLVDSQTVASSQPLNYSIQGRLNSTRCTRAAPNTQRSRTFQFNTMVDKVGRKTNFAVLVIYEEIVNEFDVFCWSHCKKKCIEEVKLHFFLYAQKSHAV